MNAIHETLKNKLAKSNITGTLLFSTPPDGSLGDIAIGCFALAKEQQKHPVEIASSIAETLNNDATDLVEKAVATGPYVNISLNGNWLYQTTQAQIVDTFGTHSTGEGKQYLVEFACPNPMKAFHLGHLRNTITGESVCRILENSGYKITRVNYQGDVGRHIAMSLWGIYQDLDAFERIKSEPLQKRVEFLGQAYARGAQAFEKDEQTKQEVLSFNKKVYDRDQEIRELYTTARQWSLDYFDTIYKTLNTRFDQLYFESQVDRQGTKLVHEYLKKGVFKKSDGAIIYEGSKDGLHDRVFINSNGFPTYEGKEVGLAAQHFAHHNPDRVIHIVGKEQTEYFKVVFKALEHVIPETTGKEQHLIGGYLQLKGDMKMSSRKGNIITGDALLNQTIEQVNTIMAQSDLKDKEEIAHAVAIAALKYSMLKAGVSDDVAFDMTESVSTSGDSGPYLLYMTARIKSMLKKTKNIQISDSKSQTSSLQQTEKALLQHLLIYPEITQKAAATLNPSVIAKYVFELAQTFSSFYHECPVLQAEPEEQNRRINMIRSTLQVMEQGLHLLGINTVENM